MKKKIIFLAVTALFAVGLAFHANNLYAVDKLLDNNVEALTDGETGTSSNYTVVGTYPHRIIIDEKAHTLTIEGISQAYDAKGKARNGCVEDLNGVCIISTTTSTYNAGVIIAYVKDILNAISAAIPLIQFILSLI
jgi:hypothetical protein